MKILANKIIFSKEAALDFDQLAETVPPVLDN